MRLAEIASRNPVRAALAGIFFAAVVTLPGLGIGTLWDNSETAYGEVAREILITHDWLVMHLNGVAWFVQPPLYFWIAALFAKMFGVGSFALRLPSALATIAMGGAVGYATARIAGARSGIYAGIILSTCLIQAVMGRLATMDALLDLTVAAAILWIFRALGPSPAASALDGRKRAAALVGAAAAVGLGMLAKGPVAPAMVLLVSGTWLAWEWKLGSGPVLPRVRTVILAFWVMVAIALPWFVLLGIQMGGPALVELIGHYTVGRYTGVIENQRGPWWYYLPVLILGFFPWIAFVPIGLARAWRFAQAPGGSLARLAIVWAVLPLVFFSFAQTKLPNYIALEFPALAIIVALWFERISAGEDRRAALYSAVVVPLTVGCITFAASVFTRDNHLTNATAAVAPQLFTLVVGMLAGSIATVIAIAFTRARPAAPYVLAFTSVLLVNFIAFVAEPAAEPLKPMTLMSALVDRDRKQGDTIAIRGVPGGNARVFYTTPGVVTIDAEDPKSFIAAICRSGTAFVVTRENDVPEVQAQAKAVRYNSIELAVTSHVALVRFDGPGCK
jgi:4-amino-4-deoxy-L-arabinose transferase-like glycosyltransferase